MKNEYTTAELKAILKKWKNQGNKGRPVPQFELSLMASSFLHILDTGTALLDRWDTNKNLGEAVRNFSAAIGYELSDSVGPEPLV